MKIHTELQPKNSKRKKLGTLLDLSMSNSCNEFGQPSPSHGPQCVVLPPLEAQVMWRANVFRTRGQSNGHLVWPLQPSKQLLENPSAMQWFGREGTCTGVYSSHPRTNELCVAFKLKPQVMSRTGCQPSSYELFWLSAFLTTVL